MPTVLASPPTYITHLSKTRPFCQDVTLTTGNLYQHLTIFNHSVKPREPTHVETSLIKLPITFYSEITKLPTLHLFRICAFEISIFRSPNNLNLLFLRYSSLLREVTSLHTVW